MKEDKSSHRIQMFYEYGFLIVGFAACFSWDAAIELKIILLLILIRVCFSWGELFSLEKQIREVHVELAKSTGILQGLILDAREISAQIIEPSRKELKPRQLEEEYKQIITEAEENFDKEYEASRALNHGHRDTITFSIIWVITIFAQLSIMAFLGWLLSQAF